MKLLTYIPARSGSKGVPGKNIKPINGVPLIAYSIFAALKSNLCDEILLSTDDPAYQDVVKPLGIRTDYIRPVELASNTSPTVDGMLHALDWYEAQGQTFDAVLLLQPSSPFRTPAHISNAVTLLKENPDATCVTGTVQLDDTHPTRIKKLVDDKWLVGFCKEAPEIGRAHV